MRSIFNNITRVIKENILLIFVLVVVVLVSAYAEGNDLDFTIDSQTDGGTFNSVQDGQDNDIDFGLNNDKIFDKNADKSAEKTEGGETLLINNKRKRRKNRVWLHIDGTWVLELSK